MSDIKTAFIPANGLTFEVDQCGDGRKLALCLHGFPESKFSWRHQMPLLTVGAVMGANVRVGLEDSLFLGKGQMAQSNAEQVLKIRRILEELSLEIAAPGEARQLLGLKGADQVTVV